jgi:hypothetical protein
METVPLYVEVLAQARELDDADFGEEEAQS